MTDDFTRFTEEAYRALVRLAKEKYRFVFFHDRTGDERTVLWRHDIDMSPQRALALARIEHDNVARATYFVHLHSHFYNALEPDVAAVLREIRRLGHDLGLHFEPDFYGDAATVRPRLEELLAFEQQVIEHVLDCPVRTFSFHNPTAEWLTVDGHTIGGLVNAYSGLLKQQYAYCSDSNGYFKTDPVPIFRDGVIPHVYLLTHPEWWVPLPLSPRDRVSRSIDGRARATADWYDRALASMGRRNVR